MIVARKDDDRRGASAAARLLQRRDRQGHRDGAVGGGTSAGIDLRFRAGHHRARAHPDQSGRRAWISKARRRNCSKVPANDRLGLRPGRPPRVSCRGGLPVIICRQAGDTAITGSPAIRAITAGRSLFVRLTRSRAGWPLERCGDSANTGDLLDLIRAICGLDRLRRCSGRRHGCVLNLPRLEPMAAERPDANASDSRSTAARAGLLFAGAVPIAGTVGERYLQSRGISGAAKPSRSAVPSLLLLPARSFDRRHDRPAGADRCGHRCRGPADRRPPDMARS